MKKAVEASKNAREVAEAAAKKAKNDSEAKRKIAEEAAKKKG